MNNAEYTPQGGWVHQSPFTWQSISNTLQRAILFAEGWRNYRVVGQGDGTLQPPFCSLPITRVDQYILDECLLESERDLEGFQRARPYYIGGIYWPYTDLPVNCSTEQYYNGESKLYPDRRMVVFPVPLHGFNSTGQPVEPTLYLFTSYKLRAANGQLVRIFWQDTLGGSGGVLVLERPEVFSTYNTAAVPGANTNTEAQASQELQNYVSIFKRKYQGPPASEVTFPGFLTNFSLDGVVAQITWNLTGQMTPWTKVCEHDELDPFAVDSREQRRRQQLASLAGRGV
jgi:hypothetical protein